MKQFLKIILFLLIQSNISFAQNSPCVEIKQQLDSIYSNYKYPTIYVENNVESNLILELNVESDSANVNWLKKSQFLIFDKEIENTFNDKINFDEDCHCIFRLNFDITCIKEKFVYKKDTLLVSIDSLSILEGKFKVFDITIKGGEEWTKWLNEAQKTYFENKSKEKFQTTNLREDMSKSVRKSKDSIFITIYRDVALFDPMDDFWTISYNAKKDKWKSNVSLNSMEILELINAFKAIPQRSNIFSGIYDDGETYFIEMKIGNEYRKLEIDNPYSYYRDYEFWLDAEYIRLIELLKK